MSDGLRLCLEDTSTRVKTRQEFNKMVLCVLADDALRILGKTASWKEELVLGGAALYDNIAVTHTDKEYFEKQYETQLSSDIRSEAKNED